MNVCTSLLITTTLVFGNATYASPPADDLLAGPPLIEEEVTDENMLSRKLNETGKKAKRNDQRQMRMWMSTMETIDLTPTQKDALEMLLKELRETQHEFQKTYGKEVASIRKETKALKKEGEVLSKETQTRMIELMDFAPDITTYQDRAWKLLSTDQQQEFQLKFQERIEKEEQLRAERKKKDAPVTDETKEDRSGTKQSKFRDVDREINIDTRNDRQGGSFNDSQLRSVKFLLRLQKLQNDN